MLAFTISFAALVAVAQSSSPAASRSVAADHLSLKTKADWDRLFQSCVDHWSKYESELSRLRSSLKREIDALSQERYETLYRKADERIRFVRVHWPSDFSAKDPGWAMYKVCSDLNWEVRKLLNSPSSSAGEKKKQIDLFEYCLQKTFYGRGKKVGPPFDRLIACYRKH